MNSPRRGAPIGVFDSGVGGLSVLRAIRSALPDEDLVYVADSGMAPWGDRDAAFIVARSTALLETLRAQGAKAVVVACNTATVVAVEHLRARSPIPIIAIEPAIKPAVQRTRSGVVGVLGTQRTIQSRSVARLCEQHGGSARILLQACPGLVERVERGLLHDDETRALLAGFVRPLLDAGADTLVLGCTHYPFLSGLLREIAGPQVAIVDPAQAVARQLIRRLGLEQTHDTSLAMPDRPCMSERTSTQHPPGADRVTGHERFLTSAPIEEARRVMSALWGGTVDIDIDSLPDGVLSSARPPADNLSSDR